MKLLVREPALEQVELPEAEQVAAGPSALRTLTERLVREQALEQVELTEAEQVAAGPSALRTLPERLVPLWVAGLVVQQQVRWDSSG